MKYLILLLLTIPSHAEYQAVIYNGDYVRALKPGLVLSDFTAGNQAGIFSGTYDPTSTALSANPGSLYMRNSGTGYVYIKNDSGSSTNWTLLSTGAGPGDITAVVAGTGLSGGSTSGSATLSADFSVVAPLANPTFTGIVTGTFSGSLTGNASTATALAANPTNCSAGNYPLGIDASGNVESCTAVTSTIVPAAIGSSPNANGMTASGMTLNLEPASDTYGGVVTTGTQTIAGDKTLTGALQVDGAATFNNDATFANGIVANGASDFNAAVTFDDDARFNTSLTLNSDYAALIWEQPGSPTYFYNIHPPTIAGDIDFTFPANEGSSGQFLKTDGAGVTSWADAAMTLSAVGSSPNANGATISGTTLNLEPASASYPGVVTTGTQTLAGAKTFSGATTFSNDVKIGSQFISNAGGPKGISIDSNGLVTLNSFAGTAYTLKAANGNILNVQSGSDTGGGTTNTAPGILKLSTGLGTGNGAGQIQGYVNVLQASGTTDQTTTHQAFGAVALASSSSYFKVFDNFYTPNVCDASGSNCVTWGATLGTSISGNAATATALAANGSNCSAGSYPLGVDASGAVESCTTAATKVHQLVCEIQNGGSVIATGMACLFRTPFSCTPGKWQVWSIDGVSGAIQIDVQQDAFTNTINGSDSIAGSEKIIITATGTTGTDTSLSSWSAVTAGSWIQFYVDSVTSLTRVMAVVECTE